MCVCVLQISGFRSWVLSSASVCAFRADFMIDQIECAQDVSKEPYLPSYLWRGWAHAAGELVQDANRLKLKAMKPCRHPGAAEHIGQALFCLPATEAQRRRRKNETCPRPP